MADYRSRQERRQALNNKHNSNGKKPKKGFFKKLILSLVLIFLFMGLAGSVAVAIIINRAPALDPSVLKQQMGTRIYYSDGSLMETVGSKNRIYAPIDKVPKVMKDAVVSVEDTRFYQHHGIDPIRIGGSVVANIKEGFGAEGASTIDQQLIKLSYLTPKKTLTRKVQEAYLAVKLDREYSKKQILEMYLNKIFYGNGAYGVGTAAYTYFGLDVDHLDQMTLSQAALLAGIPNRPAYYDPISYPDNAIKRRNLVLDMMVKNGKITKAQADAAKKVTMNEMMKNRPKDEKDKDHYAVVDMLQQLYVNTGKIDKDQWAQGGLKIYTTIDKNAQETVENLLNDPANFEGTDANIQSGIAVTDTQNGQILAVGGGINYKYGTNWALAGNTETGMGNQVGSTAKPIIDYGPAIEYLKWPTSQILDDSPHAYSDGTPVNDFDKRFKGKMTMKRALAESRNIPAVKTLQAVDKEAGVSSVVKFANKLGVNINRKNFNETYALGSFTANPLQMAGAYAAFGNNGIYNEPNAIKYIEYPDGRQIKFDHENHIAMHDYTAYMITDMLKEVIDNGTYHGPSLSGYAVAGKSGSSNPASDAQKRYHLTPREMANGYLDSWFVGYTPKITAAVWVGYDQTASVKPGEEKGYVLMTSKEKGISANLFGKVIRNVASKNTPDWKQPKSVVRVSVEKDTGLLASEFTPKSNITSALFVRGSEPTKVSTKYQKLNAPKNVKAQYDPNSQTVTLSWDYDKSDGISFIVAQNVGGQSQTLATTKDRQMVVNNLTAGNTYTFTVTAVYTDTEDESNNQNSDPATVSIQIPADQSEEPPTGPPNDPGNEKNDKHCEKHPEDPKCGPVTPPTNDHGGTTGGNENENENGNNDNNNDLLDILP
ncbi:MAG: PBP1A family penicillin-binding protein [Tuberibacillus sp.]